MEMQKTYLAHSGTYDELYHHGIKGMKWGVRRYQNKDGSLTAAGKKRAAKYESKYEQLTGKKISVKKVQNLLHRKRQLKTYQTTN